MSTGTDNACQVAKIVTAHRQREGGGFLVRRPFPSAGLRHADPFLLLDEMGPVEYGPGEAFGAPDYPHRGFETVTYMLDGRMRHRDNHGNEGVLVPGSVQWMTAGRGLVHSEMPEQQEGRMRGFQLWLNLPAREKMTAPKYQEFGPERIPVATTAPGVTVKVIAGRVDGVSGPISQPATDPTYLDIALEPGAEFTEPLPTDYAAFLCVFEGSLQVGASPEASVLRTHELGVLGEGAEIRLKGVTAGAGGKVARAILVAGRPLREPVAKYGPFVMNTREELQQAFDDFQRGRF